MYAIIDLYASKFNFIRCQGKKKVIKRMRSTFHYKIPIGRILQREASDTVAIRKQNEKCDNI